MLTSSWIRVYTKRGNKYVYAKPTSSSYISVVNDMYSYRYCGYCYISEWHSDCCWGSYWNSVGSPYQHYLAVTGQ